MIRAIYPGTFDPITIGHLDIIKRASKIYDELIIAVMENSEKSCTFKANERKELIEKCIKYIPNARVVIGSGLTIEYAADNHCKVIIRGIRAVADYEYELALATSNMNLNRNIETIFFVARPEYSFLSSSIAKEVARYNGDISSFIPAEISREVIKCLRERK